MVFCDMTKLRWQEKVDGRGSFLTASPPASQKTVPPKYREDFGAKHYEQQPEAIGDDLHRRYWPLFQFHFFAPTACRMNCMSS